MNKKTLIVVGVGGVAGWLLLTKSGNQLLTSLAPGLAIKMGVPATVNNPLGGAVPQGQGQQTQASLVSSVTGAVASVLKALGIGTPTNQAKPATTGSTGAPKGMSLGSGGGGSGPNLTPAKKDTGDVTKQGINLLDPTVTNYWQQEPVIQPYLLPMPLPDNGPQIQPYDPNAVEPPTLPYDPDNAEQQPDYVSGVDFGASQPANPNDFGGATQVDETMPGTSDSSDPFFTTPDTNPSIDLSQIDFGGSQPGVFDAVDYNQSQGDGYGSDYADMETVAV